MMLMTLIRLVNLFVFWREYDPLLRQYGGCGECRPKTDHLTPIENVIIVKPVLRGQFWDKRKSGRIRTVWTVYR
jgi:hypothetical protein